MMKNKISPKEAKVRLDRARRALSTTFELNIAGWRTVKLYQGRAIKGKLGMKDTILLYRAAPIVPTPYMPDIEGEFAFTLNSFNSGLCSWLLETRGKPITITVEFRPSNEHAKEWLVLQFAKAAGMKYRRHGLVKPDEIIYTKDA